MGPERGRHRPAPGRARRLVVGAVLGCLVAASIPLLANRLADPDRPPEPPTATGDGGTTGTRPPGLAPPPTPFQDGVGPGPERGRSGPGGPGHGAGRILVGASVQAVDGESWQEANARADRTYGPLQMHRVFYPGLPAPWEGSRAAGGGLTVVVSFKADPSEINSGRHDQRLTEWFATAPRDRDVYWVYYHEPEDNIENGDFTAGAYRRAWQRLAGLAGRADHPRLHATLVLMCWSLDAGSGRDWRDYYPGDDAIDVLGWDCYNSGGVREGYYVDPATRFTPPADVSRQVGKPWGVAEMGSELIAGDASGEQRGDWLRDVGTYLTTHDHPPLWVAYFDSTVGGDFRLRDGPSQRAWREFIRSQRG